MFWQGLDDWIEREFGARDEGLLDVELEAKHLELVEREQAVEYELVGEEMAEVEGHFEETVRAGVDAEGHERERHEERAEQLKLECEQRAERRDRHGRRLTATWVIRALRAVEGEAPQAVQRRVNRARADSSVELRRADEYLAAVADALAIDDRYLPDWSLDPEPMPEPFGGADGPGFDPEPLDQADDEPTIDFKATDDEWTLEDVIDLGE
ncbi:hypothetical protein [Halomicrobium sp. LC1Hm]|uniref:hypothetical protein n=1 Tax=Halomicrobium sp. LC1Hm TaxID=2610902 RepID=UPI0012A86D3C|nr:hypothetical protein [Halomicrobium sp. LC1Hm]QGA84376.1 hypothetical protein LC1Hm_4041 [Halomicrobium sp. LC1Hm]